MRNTIKEYVTNCDICQRTKVVRHAPYGLMKPNEAPDRPWKSISMDFITDLPQSEGNDAILIVIDQLTKMAHFLPGTKEIDARQFSELFMREIFRLHGLPKDIITDRGWIFTSDLWKETTKQSGIERRLSTAFHPQTDGQTERTNSTLEQYLRAYVNYQQDNWKELLPMAEFAYNNGYQESIKHTPFFGNYGVNPEYQTIGHLMEEKITPLENMSQLHDTLQAEMTEAQLRHKEYYDGGRKPDPNLQSGDIVWLLPRNIRTTRPCKKLDYKKIGPFKILAKIGESAYMLDLPLSMRIHNTFHISLLELYRDDKFSSQRIQPPPPIIIEGEPEYELEEIIDSRLHYGKLQYRAKWTGYAPEHDKVWYPYEDLENAGIAERQFPQGYPGKPSLDQNRGTRKRGDLGLHNTTTATCTTTTTSTNDDTKTPDTKDRPRRVGNCHGTTHEPHIQSPTRMGRSRKEGMSSKGARRAVMDSMLRRQVPSALQGQGSLGIVSPRPISVCAISTGIAPEQKTAEETPWAERDMVRMLRRQMLRTCAREDQSGVLSPGKRREETPLKMTPETPQAGTTKEIRCREDTAGEGRERKNSTRCWSPTEANPGTARPKATNTGKGPKNTTGASQLPEHDRMNTRRNPRTLQNGRGIWFQHSEVEERKQHQKASQRGARTQKPQPPKGAQKSCTELVGSGSVAWWDRC